MKYKKGDIIVGKNGGKVKILVAIDDCYLISWAGDHDWASDWHTECGLDNLGYKLDAPEWKPENLKKDDWYWFMDSWGDIADDPWEGNNKDKYRLKTGNVYQTKEKAQEALDKIMNS